VDSRSFAQPEFRDHLGRVSALWLAMGMLVPLLWGAESTWVDMAVWAPLCSVMGVPASDAAQ
jgi:hypothetical protein